MRLGGVIAALAALGVLSTTKPVTAADKYQPFNWTGIYVGAYLGHARASADLKTDAGTFTPTSYFTSVANIESINRNGSGSVNSNELVGGIQVGTNLQSGKVVFGFEADFGAFEINGSKGATNFVYPTFAAANYTMRASVETDWLLTARARLGWTPQSNLLIYATAGLALTNVRVSNSFRDTAADSGVGGTSTTETKAGLALGGGAEWALSRQWSIKAEYIYLDFGSASAKSSIFCGPAGAAICAGPPPVTPNSYTTSADISAHIARVGLNYKF